MATYPTRSLTIAGSDSGGGAGIQADLKTFSALGTYGMSVITAITAQNTFQVTGALEIPLDLIEAQLDAVVTDIGVDAVKTGMLSSPPIIELIEAKIREYNLHPVVVDPVMISKSGSRLLQESALATMRSFLGIADITTPNVPEATALSGHTVRTLDDAREAAKIIHSFGAQMVVIKGGHLTGTMAIDLLFDGNEFTELATERINTTNTHGTGCTFASAITAGLANGLEAKEAINQAKTYVTEGIRNSFSLGSGHGPLNHFHAWWGIE
jgi:hydroxymethylpyrimidine/phosphomethylpyrimidine kinase